MREEGLSILDALENLSAIIDAQGIENLELTDDSRLILHEISEDTTEPWQQAAPDQLLLDAVAKTFQVVAHHLQSAYQHIEGKKEQQHIMQGIKNVMVLAGEAARHLERTHSLFRTHLTKMSGYTQLRNFYKSTFVKELNLDWKGGALSPTETDIVRATLLNNLQNLKEDNNYELFYLKNEEGQNFFTTQLEQNIKLACDFEEYAKNYTGEDPLLQIKNWEDRMRYLQAKQILASIKEPLRNYFEHAMKSKETSPVLKLNCAIMALMLASHSRQLLRQFASKNCSQYFQDFILFLRAIIHDREFQKLQLYSTSIAQPVFIQLLEVVQELIDSLFYAHLTYDEIQSFMKERVFKSEKTKASLSHYLVQTESALRHLLAQHPSGPVLKVLDLLRESDKERYFDPLLLGLLPEHIATLQANHGEVRLLRMGCPTTQHVIHKAVVTEEFKQFLRGHEGHVLYVNLQDRTSWKEHARCIAIENLCHQAEFVTKFHVLTLPVETDFYHQQGIYEHLEDAHAFIAQFVHQLEDNATGFYLPDQIRQDLTGPFIKSVLQKLHYQLFQDAKVLDRQQRLTFVSLAIDLIILQALKSSQASSLILASKDGLDLAAVQAFELCAFLHPEPDLAWIETAMTHLYAPILLQRERALHTSCLRRTYHVLQSIENNPKDHEKLGLEMTFLRFG